MFKVNPNSFVASTILTAAHAVPATRVGRRFFPPITRLRSGDGVALTFDDGPDRDLEQFLELLEESGAKATFFVVGEQVERSPGSLREVISRGHQVGIQCHQHVDHLRLSPGQVLEDMRRSKEVVEEATGQRVRLFRPPYGHFSLSSWMEASRQGWKKVLWTWKRDARDWDPQTTPKSIANKIGSPDPGDIILLHDSDRYAYPGSTRKTLEALPAILERIHDRGLRACSIQEML